MACLHWLRTFEGRPEHLTKVREFARLVAGGRDGGDVMEIVLSELAGNAIQHSRSGEPGGEFALQVLDMQDGWHVCVVDQGGPEVPRICELTAIESVDDLDKLGDEAEAGRGLAMVAAVSADWGVAGNRTSRTVWADIRTSGKATVKTVRGTH